MNKYKKIMKELRQKREGKDITEKYNFGYGFGWYSPDMPTEKQLRAAINRRKKKIQYWADQARLNPHDRASRSRRQNLTASLEG